MKNNKRNLIFILIVSLLVVYLVLKDDFAQKIHYLLSVNPLWLLVSFILIILYWIFKGIALFCCVKQVDKKYTKKDGIKLLITTQLFHAITPFASGGQPWQIYRLKKEGISTCDSTNVIIEDFIAYQLSLIMFGVIAVVSNYLFHILPSGNTLGYLVLFGFIVNVSVVIGLFVVAFSKKCNNIIIRGSLNILEKINLVKNKNEILSKSDEYIKNFHDGAKILFRNKLNLLKIIILNFIALLFQYLIPFTLMLGLSVYMNPFYVVVVFAHVMLIDSIIPTPGSTGGLEYGFMYFFKPFVSGPKLSILMIVWRLINYYFGIIVGFIFFNSYKEENL